MARLTLAALLCLALAAGVAAAAAEHGHSEVNHAGFLLDEPERVFESDAGAIDVWGSPKEHEVLYDEALGAAHIVIEPRALFLPHYTTASELSVVVQGTAKLGVVWKGKIYEEDIEEGDVFGAPGGVVWYLLNTSPSQRLRIWGVASVAEGRTLRGYKQFYVAGGAGGHYGTILGGFSDDLLARAFDVPQSNISELLSYKGRGPIVFVPEDRFTKLTQGSRQGWISWLGLSDDFKLTYDLDKKPDFENEGGWSNAVDKEKFKLLKLVKLGAFAVNLKPGALLAPHWNPLATEVSVVTRGSGYVEISHPNGTAALRAAVKVGDVFVTPRFYPVAQLASRDYGLEFVGISTSSKPAMPQFLTGKCANSVMKAIDIEVLATAFDIPEDIAEALVDEQEEAVIVPNANSTEVDELKELVRNLPRLVRGVPLKGIA
eukprot:SM000238S08035  [mRNA]  locus=s238:10122:12968:+ [translate_table: standard]